VLVELEPGVNGVGPGLAQRARLLIGVQQLADEQRVARGEPEDPAQQRAGPAACLVEDEAPGHFRPHGCQPQLQPGVLGQRRQRTGPGRARGDHDRERQAAAGPHQPAQQAERGGVEVVRVVAPEDHGTRGAHLIDQVEGRLA
jgi:hypothetical protein